MSIFSKLFSKRRDSKHAHKKHRSNRAEYLLDESTPFDITEAFRNLKAAISVSVPKKNGGVAIMMTSAYPEDGKTTVTANLALMFALSDAKVVLVDADIRKGRVAKYFKRKSAPGLSDYLSGQNSLEEVVHHSHVNENLSYITCGTHSPRPYELLESDEMKKLIEELKKLYDFVIIDTPPLLVVSDALAIATETDGTVVVSRHQTSSLGDIAKTLEKLPIPTPMPVKYAPRCLPFTKSVKYTLNLSQNTLGVDGTGMTSPATISDGSITSTLVEFSISNISQK